MPPACKAAEMLGKRFGRLVVSVEAGRRGDKRRWFCRCDCGGEATADQQNLRSGATQSCGCLQRERTSAAGKTHGCCGAAAYKVWCDMIARCCNTKNGRYSDYGGRGIVVCERWLSFENFYADMGDRPEGMTLDRRDNDGNYEPNNCRWATDSEQAQNKRQYKNNKSGVTGVCWHNQKQKWVAEIKRNGKRRHLGTFQSMVDAIAARRNAEKQTAQGVI